MKSATRTTALSVLLSLGAVGAAIAQAPLELRPGRYVDASKRCDEPKPEAVQTYNGKALMSATSPSCKIEVLSGHGGWHVVHKRCGEHTGFTQTMRITGDDTFVLINTQRHPSGKFPPTSTTTRFRLCPLSSH